MLVRILVTAPGVAGTGDLSEVLIRQLQVNQIHHAVYLEDVDEGHLTKPITEAPLRLSSARDQRPAGIWALYKFAFQEVIVAR